MSTPHPIDLFIPSPANVIVEAKTINGRRDASFAIREAVGQLLEYRYFIGPRDAQLCILLDEEPGEALVTYAENALSLLVLWYRAERLHGTSSTIAKLHSWGIELD